MNLLKDMMNNVSLEETKRGKITYINIDELHENENNIYEVSNIEELAENIAEGGLMQPILVTEANDKLIIHTGHRRVAALKTLFHQGISINFLGKTLDFEVPIIRIDNTGDDVQNKISLIRSNSYRQLTTEQRIQIVKEASNLYQELVDRGEKPPGRQREWISSLTGISDGTTKNILAEENKIELGQVAPKEKKQELTAAKILKKVESLKKYLEEVDWDLIEDTLGIEDIFDITHGIYLDMEKICLERENNDRG